MLDRLEVGYLGSKEGQYCIIILGLFMRRDIAPVLQGDACNIEQFSVEILENNSYHTWCLYKVSITSGVQVITSQPLPLYVFACHLVGQSPATSVMPKLIAYFQ